MTTEIFLELVFLALGIVVTSETEGCDCDSVSIGPDVELRRGDSGSIGNDSEGVPLRVVSEEGMSDESSGTTKRDLMWS